MRETIGSTWIFQIVIVFILLFASYLALTINYSKSFKVKNEVVSIIERSEGLTENGIKLTASYLVGSSYKEVGHCPVGWIGAKSLDGTINSLEYVSNSSSYYYYCINKITGYHTVYPDRSYYKIKMFFRFDLPVLGRISTFDVDGQTSEIDHTYDNDILYKQIS
jgi:hypothetical protein